MSTDDEEYADLLAALQASGTANAPRNGGGIHMSICDKAASAIKRLISERDEAWETVRFVARWAWDKDSGSDAERLSVIRYYPAIRARAVLSHKPAKREGE